MRPDPESAPAVESMKVTLTSAQVKNAGLTFSKLEEKEISSILHQVPDSVKVARTRLRKKLNLDSEDNLQVYLQQF